ncbi:MAG: acyltransferase [Alphaproteobacteria bacterium]|nr:acyltransferase [Alphaproteobacteria bacterium]
MSGAPAAPRDNNFDALRLLAAISVIFSHSFLIAQGTQDHEPLIWLTGNQSILGLCGVFVFFAISGYLVTQSWERTASAPRYLMKRCLRIFPGLIVALIVSAFVLAPLVTTLPLADYLARPEPYLYVAGNAALSVKVHELPGVLFVDNQVGLVINGSLWTLYYEFLMYLMVMALGLTRLLNVWICLLLVAFGMVCVGVSAPAAPQASGFLAAKIFDLLGWLWDVGWLLSFFAIGMVLYKLRGTRVFDGRVALAAVVLLVASIFIRQFILLFPLTGCYLALWLALNPRIPPLRAARWGDLSYGLYIYGWPSEQLVIWLKGGHAAWWQVFGAGLLLAGALAFVSWHVIEARALRLKPRTRPAPAFAANAG